MNINLLNQLQLTDLSEEELFAHIADWVKSFKDKELVPGKDDEIVWSIVLVSDLVCRYAHQAKLLAYQDRVADWVVRCFGETVAEDVIERNHRFLEEALELVQALGCSQDEAHQLVDYVYGRPKGEKEQELGGVMVTLAALAATNDMDMLDAGEDELTRVEEKIEKIRAKHAAKPQFGPLPA